VVDFRFCDESEFGFSWVVGDETMRRCSHAILAGGLVWLVDPLAWPDAEERARSLGEPGGVVQLLDRHDRDCAAVAERLGVPHHRLPDGLPPFEVVRVVDGPGWHERALWLEERATLVVAEAVGSGPFYVAPGERLAVHPVLRLFPPRRLARFEPDVILVGHGEAVRGDALPEALRTSRRGIPRWLATRRRAVRLAAPPDA
jgi:hypothetical protein